MSSRTNINAPIVIKSWLHLTNDLLEDYHDRWICDESWFRIMNDKYPHLEESFDFKLSWKLDFLLNKIVGVFKCRGNNFHLI